MKFSLRHQRNDQKDPNVIRRCSIIIYKEFGMHVGTNKHYHDRCCVCSRGILSSWSVCTSHLRGKFTLMNTVHLVVCLLFIAVAPWQLYNFIEHMYYSPSYCKKW